MRTIDGALGEGGGQVLRTTLALSLVTGEPVRIDRIRAGRARPGLLRQHLACVQAAAAVGDAAVEGASLGSQALVFRPRRLVGGTFEARVGSAGSALLVLQSVLPALALADSPSTLVVEGGTHNPWAPSFEFLDRVYAPLVRRMGVGLTLRLVRPGFFPAGGGRIEVEIRPTKALTPLTLLERRGAPSLHATALLSSLPRRVGVAELEVLQRRLGLGWDACTLDLVDAPRGPGNALWVTARTDDITELFVDFGRRGRAAAAVAEAVAGRVVAWRDRGAPVGEHLADQLVLLLALAGEGAFRTGPLSSHTRTNLDTVERLLDRRLATRTEADGTVVVRANPP
jgi:RNA 3'-terminal phosphate cyclase (ATP)